MWLSYHSYQVSNLGRIKGVKGAILKGHYSLAGYHQFTLNGKKTTGHELVWSAFKGEKVVGNVINHIDGNKLNNRLSNLEEVNHQENMWKAANETNAWGYRQVEEFNDDGEVLNVYNNASEAARKIGILPGSMRNTIKRNGKCHNGLRYRYVK